MSDMINEIFDLSADALVDNSIKSRLLREYRSDANPTDADPNIVINVRDTSEWVLLNEAYLEISGLSTGTGANGVGSNAVASNMALEAGGCSSLFHTSRLRVSNVLVESNDVFSHYNSFMKQIMNSCDDYTRSIAVSNGFILDTNASADDSPYTTTLNAGTVAVPVAVDAGHPALIASTVSNPAYNSGFATRKALFGLTTASRQRQTFYLPLRFLFDFCDTNKCLKGCPIRIELVKRALDEQVYGTAGTTEAWFSIDRCSLWMPIIQPSLPVLSVLESQLAKGLSIPWTYNNWKTYASDSQTGTSRRYTFNSQSDKPIGAFLYFKINRDTATPVNQKNFNNFAFDHCSATSVQLLINGLRYPYSAYQPNWSSGNAQDTTRVYAGLMEYMKKYKAETETGSLINPLNHRSLFPFYYFDFGSLDQLPSNGGYQISVEATVAGSALGVVMYLTVISESKWNIVGGEQGLQLLQA